MTSKKKELLEIVRRACDNNKKETPIMLVPFKKMNVAQLRTLVGIINAEKDRVIQLKDFKGEQPRPVCYLVEELKSIIDNAARKDPPRRALNPLTNEPFSDAMIQHIQETHELLLNQLRTKIQSLDRDYKVHSKTTQNSQLSLQPVRKGRDSFYESVARICTGSREEALDPTTYALYDDIIGNSLRKKISGRSGPATVSDIETVVTHPKITKKFLILVVQTTEKDLGEFVPVVCVNVDNVDQKTRIAIIAEINEHYQPVFIQIGKKKENSKPIQRIQDDRILRAFVDKYRSLCS